MSPQQCSDALSWMLPVLQDDVCWGQDSQLCVAGSLLGLSVVVSLICIYLGPAKQNKKKTAFSFLPFLLFFLTFSPCTTSPRPS